MYFFSGMAPVKKTARYSPQDVLRALTAISKGSSIKKAGKTYNIPASTLQDKVRGKYRLGKSRGRDPFLSEKDEESLVKWCKVCLKRGVPAHKNDLLNTVQRMMRDSKQENPFTDDRPGKAWFAAFLKRHTCLSIRVPERVSKARSRVTEPFIRQWFSSLKENIQELNHMDIFNDPTRIYNSDESCIQLCPKSGKVIGLRGWKNIYEISPGPEKSNLTFLGTFCADGTIVKPSIVYPYQRLPKDIADKVPTGFHVLLSDSGWMRTDTFEDFIENAFDHYLVEKNQLFCSLMAIGRILPNKFHLYVKIYRSFSIGCHLIQLIC